ncbi:MAG TPA: serine hydrolase [Acidobacteriota bacterium]|nr:serine hydrolase [Acidobacteriota bacterium]
MRRVPGSVVTLLVLMLMMVSLAAVAAANQEKSLKDKIDEIVKAEAKYDLFSGAVLVAHEGEVIYSAAVGYADMDHQVKNALNTKFNIGSIGKCYTATLIMQLAQQGKIKLTDPLSKFLPDFPHPEKDKIQIQHLLNHSSGLDNYMGHKDYECKMHTLRRISDVLPLIYDQEILFQAGERFSYSNSGMVLLGAVIEKVTGTEYKDYLRQQILDPLGMADSGIVYADEVVLNRATGYRKLPDNGGYSVQVFGEPPAFSDGGLYSTVEDMLKFDQALYGEELLSEEYKQIMFTPVGPSQTYGFGWGVWELSGTKAIGHNGGCPGFNAEFRRFPEMGYTLIILSNYDGGADWLAQTINSALLGLDYAVATEFDLNFRHGFILQATGDYRKSIEYFAKNIRGDQPHLPSLYQSARSRIVGQFEQAEAIAELDRYIELADENAEPSVAAAWWRKGVAYEQLQQVDEAIECYKKSLELDPNFPQAKESLERLEEKK